MKATITSPMALLLLVFSVLLLFISPVAAWFVLLASGIVHGIETS